MATNELTVDVRVGFTVPDEVAKRCLSVVAMWLEDHPDMTVRIDRGGNGVPENVCFWRMDKGAFERPKEPAQCKYLHTISHDNEYRCWGQKDAPLCGCGGDTAKCEIFPLVMEGEHGNS